MFKHLKATKAKRIIVLFAVLLLIFQLVSCENSKEEDRSYSPLPDGFGVCVHGDLTSEDIRLLKDSGVKYVRVDLNWESIEKTKGKYTFENYDKLNKSLKELNITPYYILDYSNKLYEENQSIVSEQGRKAFANFVKEAVQRYKGQGNIWEIWNEPNIELFWKEQPSFEQYGLLVERVVPVIRKYDKTGIIIAPALSEIKSDSLRWLDELLENKEVTRSLDAISVHPYRNSRPETALEDYKKLKAVIEKHSKRNIPIISGEWGYPVNAKIHDTLITEQKQAELLVRSSLINTYAGIPISVWYDWRNNGQDPGNAQHNFGLLTYDYKTKKSYKSLVTYTQNLNGYHFDKKIESINSNDFILRFKNKKGKNVLVFWTVGAPHSESLKLKDGSGELMSLLGEKTSIKWAKNKLTLDLTTSPTYLIIK